jgi:hypothetical protein
MRLDIHLVALCVALLIDQRAGAADLQQSLMKLTAASYPATSAMAP